MDGGVVRLILAAIAAVMILCVSVSGTDLTIVLLGGIALVLIRRTWRAPLGPPKKTNDQDEGDAVSCTNMTPYAFHTVRSALRGCRR